MNEKGREIYVKVYFNESNIRRFSIKPDLNLNDLKNRIQTLIDVKPEDNTDELKYCNIKGEWVNIVTEFDWKSSIIEILQLNEKNKILKLRMNYNNENKPKNFNTFNNQNRFFPSHFIRRGRGRGFRGRGRGRGRGDFLKHFIFRKQNQYLENNKENVKNNFENELKSLNGMGFNNNEKNLSLLQKYSGDICNVINELVQN